MSVLSAEQQQQLQKKKIELRISNERYLQKHPEVHVMLKLFCEEVLQLQTIPPSAELVLLAKQFFAFEPAALKERVEAILQHKQQKLTT